MKFVYTFINSFLRTLARILCYAVIGGLLGYIVVKMGFKLPLFALDVHALETDGVPDYLSFNYSGYVNDTHVYEQDNYDETTQFSNTAAISSGNEVKLKIFYERYSLKPINYLVQVSLCTTSSSFAGASTPLIDFNRAELIKAYSTNSMPVNNCYVNGYTGKMYILNYALSIPADTYTFNQTIWSGTHDNYNQFVHILNVNAVEYTNELAQMLDSNEKASTTINQNNTIINQNDTIINKNNEIKQGVDDIKSSITDESSPNTDALKNSSGWLPAGPLDSLINLPLSLLNNLTTNMSKSCQPVNLPLPFLDKNLQLPCVNTLYAQIDGLSVWINSVSVIAAAFILFHYLMGLYKWVDDTLSFRENNYIDNWTGV